MKIKFRKNFKNINKLLKNVDKMIINKDIVEIKKYIDFSIFFNVRS
jgi:hypothetical protein